MRIVAAFVGLPLIVLLDSLLWFGLSSVLPSYVTGTWQGGLELDYEFYGTIRAWQLPVLAGATVLGGIVAIGLGARFTMVLGLLICSVGVAALGLVGVDGVLIAAIVVAVGQGIYRPCVYAAAAEVLPFPRGQLRNVLFVGVYLTMNLGASLSGFVIFKIMDLTEFAVIFVALGAMGVLAALLALTLAVVHLAADPARRAAADGVAVPPPPVPTTRRVDPRFLAVGLGLIVVTAVPWMSFGLMWDLQFRAADMFAPNLMDTRWFFSLNPLLVIFMGIALAALLLVLHLTRIKVPTLLPAGLGMMVIGGGMAILLLSFAVGHGAMVVLAIVVLAAGEVLMAPLLASRIAGDQHGRLVTLMCAMWLVAGYLGSQLLTRLGPDALDALQLIGWAVTVICVLVGLLLAAAAYPLRKLLTPAPSEPPPGTPMPY